MNAARLAALLERYFDRELAADEKAELESLLLVSVEARARFWEETEWRARFHQWGQEQAGRAVANPVLVPFPRPMLRRMLALAAVVMLCALGVWAWQRNQSVARVGELAGAVWNHKSGDALRRGTVRLTSGVAEIVFVSGARVVLEGPAELRLVSDNECALRRGKLRASVPPTAHGFTVRGEGFAAVDLGTEFGVVAGDAPEVHVFEGRVTVRGASERLLAKSEAVRISAGKMDAIAAQPELFPGGARLAAAALAGHPAAVAVFDFDGPLANRAVTNCQPAEGRWPGGKALAFSSEEDRVRFTVPGEFPALTLLAWVRVDALPNVQNALMMSESELPGDVHWYIHRTAGLGLAVIAPDGRWRSLTTGTPLRREQLGTWLFLAATFDGATGTATLYINGRAAATQSFGDTGPLRPGTVELGNWGLKEGTPLRASKNVVKEPAGYIRNLVGRMDDFGMLSTPLSAEEIHALYEAGRATADTTPTLSK